MKIKVCGMKYPDNLQTLAKMDIDYLGFIFYKPSKRYCAETLPAPLVTQLKTRAKKVGVFVNETIDDLLYIVDTYQLDMIQLHGDENISYCEKLKSTNKEIIKVFSIDNDLPLEEIHLFEPYIDYFLFDTKTPLYGGSGVSFDWSVLKKYTSKKPFFLSGGIDENFKLEDIKVLEGLPIMALDINSKFEISPGLKDIEKVRTFIQDLNK
jgi:phosphoribosylanthranilate isomerase